MDFFECAISHDLGIPNKMLVDNFQTANLDLRLVGCFITNPFILKKYLESHVRWVIPDLIWMYIKIVMLTRQNLGAEV